LPVIPRPPKIGPDMAGRSDTIATVARGGYCSA
jgi:hypothetical protein